MHDRILGDSDDAVALRRAIRRVARSDCNVLITGESGVGKELVAHGIHALSSRAGGPFVPLNCSAVADTLVESEFFGHERGAFTDARDRHVGAFERADEGTLYLDEVGDLSPHAQPKLLRALETGQVLSVGGEQPRQLDVRVVAATNQDLQAMCRRRTFRADLYYRLCVVEIAVPPLRDHPEDIPLLARHFVSRISTTEDRPELRLTPEAVTVLKERPWPGNVRQLRTAIESAAAMSRGAELSPECFDAQQDSGEIPSDVLSRDWRTAHERFERLYVRRLLKRHGGQVDRAAKSAGLAKGSLYKIIRRLGLTPSRHREHDAS